MSAGNHHEEGSFWPAYVDAITNVMLNILFVVAVFAMALNTVVKDAPKEKPSEVVHSQNDKNDRPERNTQETNRPIAIQPQGQPQEPQPHPLFVQDSAPPGGHKPLGLHWAILRQGANGDGLVRFDFGAGQSRISPEHASDVRETLRQISIHDAAPQWLIWVSLNTRNSADARHAYLRAMAVRTALIDSGQIPQTIEVRLLDSGQGELQGAAQQTVWLARSQKSSAKAPPIHTD